MNFNIALNKQRQRTAKAAAALGVGFTVDLRSRRSATDAALAHT